MQDIFSSDFLANLSISAWNNCLRLRHRRDDTQNLNVWNSNINSFSRYKILLLLRTRIFAHVHVHVKIFPLPPSLLETVKWQCALDTCLVKMSRQYLSIILFLLAFITCGAIAMLSDQIKYSNESFEHCNKIVVTNSYSSGKALHMGNKYSLPTTDLYPYRFWRWYTPVQQNQASLGYGKWWHAFQNFFSILVFSYCCWNT